MLDLTQCSTAQTQAITHGEGPMLVLAGPGSGKTFVITRRIQYLIEYHHVRPEQILVITFTKAAATQMQERFVELTSNQYYPVSFGTFHAFFYQILKQTYSFNASSILRESDKRKYIQEILRHMPKELADEQCMLTASMCCGEEETNEDMLQRLLSEISKVKNLELALTEYESSICTKNVFTYIYEQYNSLNIRRNRLDFDDMVLLCLKLLRDRPDVLSKWQARFPYLLIDEFQDISPAQYEAVRLLSAPHNNLFIVGDDDQSIYGFRGSNPKLMLGFSSYYPDAEQVVLDRNFRSKPDIVAHASNLISYNRNRFRKEPLAAQKEAGIFRVMSFENRAEQTRSIITLIRQYMKQPEAEYKDIAVLYRTNTYAAMLADCLLSENIPFVMQDRPQNIYQSQTAKDILAYIRYAQKEDDVASFYRIMNRPSRYIRRESVPVKPFTMQELLANNREKDYVIHNVLTLYNQLHFLRGLTPYAAVNYIRHGIGYEEYLKEQAIRRGGATTRQLRELDELQERAAAFDTLKEWLYHAEHYDELMEQKRRRAGEDAVQLVTMHASKGLEWRTVILPDVNEGVTPHKKAVTAEELEEERRMFYVAMTRAKENLFLFYIKEKTGGDYLPSRFLSELNDKKAD